MPVIVNLIYWVKQSPEFSALAYNVTDCFPDKSGGAMTSLSFLK